MNNSFFEQLISNVTPKHDSPEVKEAKSYHEQIREHLQSSDTLGYKVINSLLYGSYRRETAILSIKDIDIILLCDISPDDDTPQQVLRKLKKELTYFYEDVSGAGDTDYNRKSILVKPSDTDFSMDVLPAINQGEDRPLLIPDRELGKWVESNPLVHTKWYIEQNAKNTKFKPLVRLIKYWWSLNGGKHPKGFWLEVFISNNIGDSRNIKELFSTFIEITVNEYERVLIPILKDPGFSDGRILGSGIEIKDFEKFYDYAEKTLKAIDSLEDVETEDEQYEIWKGIFGEHTPDKQKFIDSMMVSSPFLVTSSITKPYSEGQDENVVDDLVKEYQEYFFGNLETVNSSEEDE